MYFSVIFLNAPEGPSFTYDLVFHPNPCWYQGNKLIYSSSILDSLGFEDLLKSIPSIELHTIEGQEIIYRFEPQKTVKILCHEGGHGTELDLNRLVEEIKKQGFEVATL
jgi:hypothetical protein